MTLQCRAGHYWIHLLPTIIHARCEFWKNVLAPALPAFWFFLGITNWAEQPIVASANQVCVNSNITKERNSMCTQGERVSILNFCGNLIGTNIFFTKVRRKFVLCYNKCQSKFGTDILRLYKYHDRVEYMQWILSTLSYRTPLFMSNAFSQTISLHAKRSLPSGASYALDTHLHTDTPMWTSTPSCPSGLGRKVCPRSSALHILRSAHRIVRSPRICIRRLHTWSPYNNYMARTPPNTYTHPRT